METDGQGEGRCEVTRPSPAQLRALEVFAEGGGPGECWAQESADDRLAWYRHERTLDALYRRGWVGMHGITDAGREVLRTNAARNK